MEENLKNLSKHALLLGTSEYRVFLLDRRLIFFHLNLILTTELQFESFCSCFEGEKKIKIVFKNWIPFLSHFNLLKICKYVKSQDFDLESYGLVGFYFWDIKLFDKPRGIIFFVIFLSALTLNCVSPIHSFEQHTPHLFLLSNREPVFLDVSKSSGNDWLENSI